MSTLRYWLDLAGITREGALCGAVCLIIAAVFVAAAVVFFSTDAGPYWV